MTIPKSYEALAADLASEKILSKTLLGQKEAYMMLADKGRLDLATWKQKACEAAEREAALREELNQYEPVSHGTASKRARWLLNIQDACKYGLPKHLVQRLNNTTKEIQNSIKYGGTKRLRDENESLQQRLTVAEQLLGDWYAANANGEILVADSAYKIVTETAAMLHEEALKPAAEGEGS